MSVIVRGVDGKKGYEGKPHYTCLDLRWDVHYPNHDSTPSGFLYLDPRTYFKGEDSYSSFDLDGLHLFKRNSFFPPKTQRRETLYLCTEVLLSSVLAETQMLETLQSFRNPE